MADNTSIRPFHFEASSGHHDPLNQCPLLGVPGNDIEKIGFLSRFTDRPTVCPATWPERPVEGPWMRHFRGAGPARASDPAPEPDRVQRTNLTRYNALSWALG